MYRDLRDGHSAHTTARLSPPGIFPALPILVRSAPQARLYEVAYFKNRYYLLLVRTICDSSSGLGGPISLLYSLPRKSSCVCILSALIAS